MRIARPIAGLLAGLVLTSCAQPEVRLETQIVEKPVAVTCIAPADIPVQPAGLGPPPADQGAALSLALARLLEWRAWGVAASAALQACSRLPG